MTARSLGQHTRAARAMMVGAALALWGAASAFAAEPIKIGQIAALSGASAQSGEAITRGLIAGDRRDQRQGRAARRAHAGTGAARR